MKKRSVRIAVLLLAFAWLFTGCAEAPEQSTPSGEVNQPTQGTVGGNVIPNGAPGEPVRVDFEKTDEEMFAPEDYQDSWSDPITVKLQDGQVTASSDSVRVSGKIVTFTGAATYLISGSLTDGMLVVDAGKSDTVHLILDGVSVNAQTSAALYVRKAHKVIVTLAEGSENSLSNGGSFVAVDESTIDGAVFSKKDLTFNGTGSLEITSPAGHGIVCKDNLVITGGSYSIAGAGHGLDANDSIRISGAALTIDAGQDGIHGETTGDTTLGFVYLSGGAVAVEAEGDGISAGAWLQLQEGKYDLLCGGGSENGTKVNSGGYGDFMGGGPGGPGGGPGGMGGGPGGRSSDSTGTDTADSTSMKGLKAAAGLIINGGTVTVDSADDAIHSDLSMVINGGTFTVASGDDALHAEKILTLTGCDMTVSECYEGLEAHEIYISGGTVKLTSTDDGMNAAGGNDDSGSGGRDQMFGPGGPGGHGGNSDGVVSISGGVLYLNASGDGIDSNGSLTITGGYTVVCGPTRGDTAVLDYDNTATIDGGTFIGTGAVMMAQTLTSQSGQGVVAGYSRQGFSAGTQITLTDANGKQIISYMPELGFQLIILSTPEMVSGAGYTLTAGEATVQVTAS